MQNKSTHTSKKKILTIVNFILDKSGSMQECKEGTIAGFNKYIATLKKQEQSRVLFSLTLFDTSYQKRYTLMPIEEVQRLTDKTYQPDGSTALWDAAVDATEEAYEKSKQFVEDKPVCITVILTDGEENSSSKHDRGCMNDLVEKLQKEGNWTFVYLGANQDSWANASQVGMSIGNTANFKASNAGMMKSMHSLSIGTVNLMAQAGGGGGAGTNNFFAGLKDEDNNLA